MNPLIGTHTDRVLGPETKSTWLLQCNGSDSASTSLHQVWRALLAASEDPFAMHQSPEWFEVLRAEAAETGSPVPSLAIRRNSTRQVVGVVPLHSIQERLIFPLALRRAVVSRPRQITCIPSGRLLLPDGDRMLDGLFNSMGLHGPERRIIRLSNVPVPSPLNTYVETSPLIRRNFCVHVVPGVHKVYTISLPPSYDEFMARYSAKKRYNLRRQFRQLEQHVGAGLTLRRFETPDEVPEFLAYWAQILATRETPHRRPIPLVGQEARNRRLAGLGLFCSYVLCDAARPIASLFGYRYGSVFTVERTLHDQGYNAFSPGTCLLHMVVEQLLAGGSARLINLGYGSPNHDYRATHTVLDYVSYWLIPSTWRSRLFQFGYGRLRRGIAAVKSGLARRNAVPGEPAADAQG